MDHIKMLGPSSNVPKLESQNFDEADACYKEQRRINKSKKGQPKEKRGVGE